MSGICEYNSAILFHCQYALISYQYGKQTVVETWAHLKGLHETSNKRRAFFLKNTLFSIIMDDQTLLQANLNRIQEIRDQLLAIGRKMEEEDIVVITLRKFTKVLRAFYRLSTSCLLVLIFSSPISAHLYFSKIGGNNNSVVVPAPPPRRKPLLPNPFKRIKASFSSLLSRHPLLQIYKAPGRKAFNATIATSLGT